MDGQPHTTQGWEALLVSALQDFFQLEPLGVEEGSASAQAVLTVLLLGVVVT